MFIEKGSVYLFNCSFYTVGPVLLLLAIRGFFVKALSAAAHVSGPSLHTVSYQHIMQPLFPSTAVVPSPFPLSRWKILQQRNVNLQPHPACFYQV